MGAIKNPLTKYKIAYRMGQSYLRRKVRRPGKSASLSLQLLISPALSSQPTSEVMRRRILLSEARAAMLGPPGLRFFYPDDGSERPRSTAASLRRRCSRPIAIRTGIVRDREQIAAIGKLALDCHHAA